MDEVELRFGAVGGYGVFGGGMDVPTGEVDGLVVVREAWIAGEVVLFVRNGEGRAETPVVEVAFECAVVVECGLMVDRRANFEPKAYGHLVAAHMTHLIVCNVLSVCCQQ